MDFKDQVVLIIDASSGIGRNAVMKFAELGTDIVLVARKKDKLE